MKTHIQEVTEEIRGSEMSPLIKDNIDKLILLMEEECKNMNIEEIAEWIYKKQNQTVLDFTETLSEFRQTCESINSKL